MIFNAVEMNKIATKKNTENEEIIPAIIEFIKNRIVEEANNGKFGTTISCSRLFAYNKIPDRMTAFFEDSYPLVCAEFGKYGFDCEYEYNYGMRISWENTA